MKIVTLLLALVLQASLAFGASVVANPDGSQTITGAIEQYMPNENTASVKVKGLRKVLVIQNLFQFSEAKLALLQQSLDDGSEVKLQVSSANKILDVLQ